MGCLSAIRWLWSDHRSEGSRRQVPAPHWPRNSHRRRCPDLVPELPERGQRPSPNLVGQPPPQLDLTGGLFAVVHVRWPYRENSNTEVIVMSTMARMESFRESRKKQQTMRPSTTVGRTRLRRYREHKRDTDLTSVLRDYPSEWWRRGRVGLGLEHGLAGLVARDSPGAAQDSAWVFYRLRHPSQRLKGS